MPTAKPRSKRRGVAIRTQAKWHQGLGVVAWSDKRYPEAISEYQTALSLEERIPGHSVTEEAGMLNDLGMSYRGKGEYDKAEGFYLRALHEYDSALGANHPDSLVVLNNLGILEESRGHYDKALA